MQRFFVTGGSGFLGASLIAGLTARGAQVTALCREVPPQPWAASCTWVKGDLQRPDSYAGAMPGADAVIHLAAATGTDLTIEADGADEKQALDAVVRLISNRFGEDE